VSERTVRQDLARGKKIDPDARAPIITVMPTAASEIPALLHRASELALSGAYADSTGVTQHLLEEGYDDAGVVLGDDAIRFQIDQTCKRAFNALRP
jgi:hypothetical protein